MRIKEFVDNSEGVWKSMRSSHSLTFKMFEEIISTIKIKKLSLDNPDVKNIINTSRRFEGDPISPFRIEWKAESDWNPDDKNTMKSGSSLFIPIPITSSNGIILRSSGYNEDMQTYSSYSFLSDGTFKLKTHYSKTIAEERIWFTSKNVRCRSSEIKTIDSNGVLQISFASEVKKLVN